jgi:hypothetical protein
MMNFLKQLMGTLPTLEEIKVGVRIWSKENGKFWVVSVGMHVLIFIVLGVAIGAPHVKKVLQEVVFFDTEIEQAVEEKPIEHFEIGETPIEPTVLNTDTLTEPVAATIEQDAQFNDNSDVFTEASGTTAAGANFGGLGGFDVSAIGGGPAVRGPGGVGGGVGTTDKGGFSSRGSGSRAASLARDGGTADSERAVAGAMNWLARHQNPDGSWGCTAFTHQCKDPSCSANAGKGGSDYPMAATAFGLLPFFGGGQTHKTGPYKGVIEKGLLWMSKTQDPKTGRLGGGNMYEHGLATIAVCEAYGLSKDPGLRRMAEGAVAFIAYAQNDYSGGWHYSAKAPTAGDTSVVGWQLMGLKSAQMAGLQVNPQTLIKSQRFLTSVAKGKSGGLFSYTPEGSPSPAMSAVGLLCSQYSGMTRTDPAMLEGMNYVMSHLGGAKNDSYFLYYATQVMHNLPGPEWDTWNRAARRHLISTQIKQGCAEGSWTANGHTAGPVMATSIHALTLEVYYRYLPLYQLDNKKQAMAPGE